MRARLGREVESARLGSVVELLRTEPVCPAPYAGTLRLAHYGNFFPIQGVDVMIDAMRRLGDAVTLELIGDYPRPLSFPANVRLHGRLAPDKMIDVMASCHAVLGQFGSSPQRVRVVPTKIYDALALGLPAICGENAELSRLAESTDEATRALRLVPPDDPDRLAAAIAGLQAEYEAGESGVIGEIARRLYLGQLGIDCVHADWLRLLASKSLR